MPPRTAADKQLALTQADATDADVKLSAEEVERVEDKPDGMYVELKSAKTGAEDEFRLQEDIGVMALMEWAAAGDGDKDESTFNNLKAVYHVLESIVDPEEFVRFRAFCRKQQVTFQEMVDFQNVCFEVISGNPTE